jgi:hypothetical protein
VREVVIPKRRSPERSRPRHEPKPIVILPDPPAAGRAEPRPVRPPTAHPRPHRPARAGRDFIVRYDGRFLCHFRSRRPLPARNAFHQVARELRAKIQDFSAERLELFRPVKLRTGGAAKGSAPPDGAFFWFSA